MSVSDSKRNPLVSCGREEDQELSDNKMIAENYKTIFKSYQWIEEREKKSLKLTI